MHVVVIAWLLWKDAPVLETNSILNPPEALLYPTQTHTIVIVLRRSR